MCGSRELGRRRTRALEIEFGDLVHSARNKSAVDMILGNLVVQNPKRFQDGHK